MAITFNLICTIRDHRFVDMTLILYYNTLSACTVVCIYYSAYLISGVYRNYDN